jgi:hypothetical protein
LVSGYLVDVLSEPEKRPPPHAAAAPRSEVAGYGSLAQEVVAAGAAGVVAMRYSVYAATAAQFVDELYRGLAGGLTLGEAVCRARKHLADKPDRQVAHDPRPLQDWCVPLVYERTELRLWPKTAVTSRPEIVVPATNSSAAALDPQLPRSPDAGFYGRHETLYALDRAFDTSQIVLLHAFAGSGKTATAVEFARWYQRTGGVDGPVLFSSFERYLPLTRVLDRIGATFGEALANQGIHWGAITDLEQRRAIALAVLEQVPVLWIWDNVEPISGFPRGTASAWTIDEQQELVDFLRDARVAKARFLLTSRRDEHNWLGEQLATRVEVPPMPMRERLELASALVQRGGRRLRALPDLRPLLRFTMGNPLTILVTVGQALRDGITTADRLDKYVEALQRGSQEFDDEQEEGRSRSLGASLRYGFDHAFGADDLRHLAVLHLFQGFVDVDVFRMMRSSNLSPDAPHTPIDRTAGIALLDRAAEVGILTPAGAGYYMIHPALPWFLKDLFVRYYADDSERAKSVQYAFTAAIGNVGNYYHGRYNEHGESAWSQLVQAEETNLLAAYRSVLTHGWWENAILVMQGLQFLYEHTGQTTAWHALVRKIVPAFIDPATDGPLPGREPDWGIVNQYRVRMAWESGELELAERLQAKRVEICRQAAIEALARPVDALSDSDRYKIRALATSLGVFSQFQEDRGGAACIVGYRESHDLFLRIGIPQMAGGAATSLGDAYRSIEAVRDLDKAEEWYLAGRALYNPDDHVNHGKVLGQLALLARERARRSAESGQPHVVIEQLVVAERHLRESLARLPPSAKRLRIAVRHQLADALIARARIHGEGPTPLLEALAELGRALRDAQNAGTAHECASIRLGTARVLEALGRRPAAAEYAAAAARDFAALGPTAAQHLATALAFLAELTAPEKAEAT